MRHARVKTKYPTRAVATRVMNEEWVDVCVPLRRETRQARRRRRRTFIFAPYAYVDGVSFFFFATYVSYAMSENAFALK